MSTPPPEVQINQRIGSAPLDDRPTTLHEAMTRQMVVDLKAEIGEIRGRINGLIFTVIAAVVVQLALLYAGKL